MGVDHRGGTRGTRPKEILEWGSLMQIVPPHPDFVILQNIAHQIACTAMQ